MKRLTYSTLIALILLGISYFVFTHFQSNEMDLAERFSDPMLTPQDPPGLGPQPRWNPDFVLFQPEDVK